MKTALALAVGLLLIPALSHAQTVITNDGTTTPTITSPSVGAFFGYNGSDYDASQGFTDHGTDPGETFLTLNTAPTYNLNSITLQQSAGSRVASSDVFTLGVFSVSGSTLTSLGTENYVFNGTAPGASGYFTLDTSALGLVLNANTEYAFSFSNGPGNGDYLGLVSSRSGAGKTTPSGDDTYSNGEAIIDATPTAAGNTETLTPALDSGNTYDRAFSVDLSAVPEPSTWAMMLGSLGVLVGLQHLRRRAL
jgi:hypothetical protein